MIPEIYCKDKCFWTEVRTWNIFLKVPQETKAHTKPQPSKNMKKTIQLLVALAIGISGQANAQTIAIGVIGDFETGSNDFGSFWKAGSFEAYDHSWGGVADQTPPLANGGQFYAYTPAAWGQIGKTMGTLQANTNYTLSLDYQGIYGWGDRPYIELTGYDGVSEIVFAAGYAGPASNDVWRTGTLSLSAAAISANYPTWVGQEFNVKISGAAIAVDNVTLTAVPTYASWATDYAGSQAANLDWDKDGVSNGVEFFMNVAPGFTANPGLVGNTVTWPNGGNIPSSEYPSQFEVQTSTDLANWLAVASDDITLSNTAGALTWKVASIANGDMGSFTGNLPSSWVVSGGALTSAQITDNSPFTNKFAANGSSWIIDDSSDTSGSAGFLQAFSNKTNYPSVEVNFDFKLTALTGGTWGIQFDGAGANLVTGSSSVHYRIDAAGQFAINAGPAGGVITPILALEADKWYNVRATFTTTAVNTGSNNGAGVQSGTITPAGGSPVSWSNVPLLNTSLGFSRLLVRDRDASFAGDLLLDNVSVAPLLGKQFVRLKVTPN
jgi:hypothetical protein